MKVSSPFFKKKRELISHGVKPVSRGSGTEVRDCKAHRGSIMNEKQSGWKPWGAGKQMLCPNGGGASILQPIDVCRNTEAME